ncbi:hypothetical protein C1645_736894 [Glomus cerebriforme]|uniref:Uncharacterized protein n=1 Tax=Glomus cerebriforme TaxID=658196 RepID=A0A397T0H3_9GLOM|nr:hypothetical protein C1645_736894 [Glomus cerebriforme]
MSYKILSEKIKNMTFIPKYSSRVLFMINHTNTIQIGILFQKWKLLYDIISSLYDIYSEIKYIYTYKNATFDGPIGDEDIKIRKSYYFSKSKRKVIYVKTKKPIVITKKVKKEPCKNNKAVNQKELCKNNEAVNQEELCKNNEAVNQEELYNNNKAENQEERVIIMKL